MDASYSTSVASASSIGADRCSTTADDDSLSLSDVTDDLDPEAISPRPISNSSPTAPATTLPTSSLPPPPHCSSPLSATDMALPPQYKGRKTDDDVKPPKFYFLQSPTLPHHRGLRQSSLDVSTMIHQADVNLQSFYGRCVVDFYAVMPDFKQRLSLCSKALFLKP
jgi:hypothetical protein